MAQADVERLLDPLIAEINNRIKNSIPEDEKLAARIYAILNILDCCTVEALGILELAKDCLLSQGEPPAKIPKNLQYIR